MRRRACASVAAPVEPPATAPTVPPTTAPTGPPTTAPAVAPTAAPPTVPVEVGEHAAMPAQARAMKAIRRISVSS